MDHHRPSSLTRRRFLTGAAGVSALAMLSGCASTVVSVANSCPSDPSASGGITWPPDVGHPVFYGFHDLAKADGPPRDMLIYYPSVDGVPGKSQIIELCLTRWPVVYFLHGQPPDGVAAVGYQRRWGQIAATIARCGYVVVLPNHSASLPDQDYGPLVDAVLADLTWVRTQWVYSQWVDPRLDATVVAGHSYGALLAARVAAAHPELAGLVSLSGGYLELSDPVAAVRVNPPSFFMWATGGLVSEASENLDGSADVWDSIPQWKYAGVFPGEHFDYLAPADSGSAPRGPCPLIGAVAADLAALFVGENLPTPLSRTHVGVDLQPPSVQLTAQQQFYAAGQFASLDQFGSSKSCQLKLRWNYDTQIGSRNLGP